MESIGVVLEIIKVLAGLVVGVFAGRHFVSKCQLGDEEESLVPSPL